MSFFKTDHKRERELLQQIEDQQKTLQKYKSRLHDVVESYKNLLKEKEALQESIKVLTDQTTELAVSECSSDVESTDISTQKVIVEQPDGKNHVISSLDSLKNNLGTLTSEKARMEKEFNTDRKRLLRENEQLQNQLKEKEILWSDDKIKLEASVNQLKKHVREHQKDRDKEHENNVLMLKELQSVVADERASKEKLEQQIDNLKFALEKLPDRRYEYEKRISELSSELEGTKDLLKVAEGEKEDLPSIVQQLDQKLIEMKGAHYKAVDREIIRANKAEDEFKALARTSEERAASLEQRLSELSQIVGSYDKVRQQDQMAIQKLKERVTQLDQENMVLTRTVSVPEKVVDCEDDLNCDVPAIVDRITKLKGHLRVAIQKSKKPFSVGGSLNEIQRDADSNIHTVCQKEIMQLQEELEQYKHREQQFKDQNNAKSNLNTEITSLEERTKALKEELYLCQLQQKAADEQRKTNEQTFQRCIREMISRHEHELCSQRHGFQVKILELDQQLQKQRERTMLLLEDKEKEIKSLKSKLLVSHKTVELNATTESNINAIDMNSEMPWTYADDQQLSELISTSLLPTKKGRQILHFTQEMSRKDVEIFNLRRSRSQAETALRELQQVSALKDERNWIEIEELEAKIQRLETEEKGVNMEYLKNVVLRFIKCSKGNDQSHMLNAIAAVLHFTTLELEDAKGALNLV